MKRQSYYVATRENSIVWSENPQTEITCNPDDLAEIAYAISKVLKREIRVSDSKGFNNQGYYYLANQ